MVLSKGWRRIEKPFAGMGDGLYEIFSFGSTLSHLNLVTMLCMKTSIRARAYSLLGYIRGPPPKGTKVNGLSPLPSNIKGSNFSGSGKYFGFL